MIQKHKINGFEQFRRPTFIEVEKTGFARNTIDAHIVQVTGRTSQAGGTQPLLISCTEAAPRMWQNNIATRCVQELIPFGCYHKSTWTPRSRIYLGESGSVFD